MLYKYRKKLGKRQVLSLRYQDSNLGRQNQNLQCYHYTIPQFRGAKLKNYLQVQELYLYLQCTMILIHLNIEK